MALLADGSLHGRHLFGVIVICAEDSASGTRARSASFAVTPIRSRVEIGSGSVASNEHAICYRLGISSIPDDR